MHLMKASLAMCDSLRVVACGPKVKPVWFHCVIANNSFPILFFKATVTWFLCEVNLGSCEQFHKLVCFVGAVFNNLPDLLCLLHHCTVRCPCHSVFSLNLCVLCWLSEQQCCFGGTEVRFNYPKPFTVFSGLDTKSDCGKQLSSTSEHCPCEGTASPRRKQQLSSVASTMAFILCHVFISTPGPRIGDTLSAADV